MIDILGLANEIEALDVGDKGTVARVCSGLSKIEGCQVTFDSDGDFRFWKWGDEFFCAAPERVIQALRAIGEKHD